VVTDRQLIMTIPLRAVKWIDYQTMSRAWCAFPIHSAIHSAARHTYSAEAEFPLVLALALVLCFPVKQRPSRYQLRSSQSRPNHLTVPPVKLSTYGSRSFAVAGPTTWNILPEYLRDHELSIDNFRRQLKTFLFAQYCRRHTSALETSVPLRSINVLFTLSK